MYVNVCIKEVIFADDLLLISNKNKDLETHIRIWEEELKKWNMEANKDKMKVQARGYTIASDVRVGGVIIE